MIRMRTSLIGQRFGKLTVLAKVGKPPHVKGSWQHWRCRCLCGQEKVIRGHSLTSGKTVSCGCVGRQRLLENQKRTEIKDERGNRYGRLLVVDAAGTNKYGRAVWLCCCDCGGSVTVPGRSLRRGHTRSCGCLHHDVVTLPAGEAAFNAYLRGLRRGAKERGYRIALSREEVRKLTQRACHYCGAAPAHRCQWRDSQGHIGNGAFTYNGLDRVDNEQGYTVNNVVPCCGQCNRAKSDMTFGAFVDWVRSVYQRHGNVCPLELDPPGFKAAAANTSTPAPAETPAFVELVLPGEQGE